MYCTLKLEMEVTFICTQKQSVVSFGVACHVPVLSEEPKHALFPEQPGIYTAPDRAYFSLPFAPA